MTRATPKLTAYVALGAACLIAALTLSRAELVAVGAPFILVAAVALAFWRPPSLHVTTSTIPPRLIEGQIVTLTVTIESHVNVPRVTVEPRLAGGLEVANPGALTTTLRARLPAVVNCALRCRRSGAGHLDVLVVRGYDRMSLLVEERVLDLNALIRVYPRADRLARALQPWTTQARSGNRVSRSRGDGIEFADVRVFAPGDRVRRINWRLTSRRREVHVNDFLPERNADVVLLLDTFSEVVGRDGSSMELALRAVSSIATYYLDQGDRVGLVGFGGALRWLFPAMGWRQQQRIVEALLDTEVTLSYAWKGIEILPPRLLPPKAMVIAVTPLLDDRTISAIVDLRARRYDVAVIEVSPASFAAAHRTVLGGLAWRLWLLQREALRQKLRTAGIGVGEWHLGAPLSQVCEEVGRFRRFVTTGRA